MSKVRALKWLSCLVVMFALFAGVPVYATGVEDEVKDVEAAPEADTQALSTGDVEINESNFPDDVFREYMYQFDNDENGTLDLTEIENCTDIRVVNYGVDSLEGIEFLSNLQYLNCGFNTLKDLDVSQNKELVDLMCWDNFLEDLDTSQNPKLENLYCDGNSIANLDVVNNANLKSISCGNNNLNTLDVSQNANLEVIICDENNLDFLDISHNPNLKELLCTKNDLTALDTSQNPELHVLVCGFNEIVALDVSRNTGLEKLACEKNQLGALDISQDPELKELECSYNTLGTLDISHNFKLESLTCLAASLGALDTSQNAKIQMIECSYNKLSTLDLSQNPDLKELFCVSNKIHSIIGLENYEALNRLILSDNELTTLPDLTSTFQFVMPGQQNKYTDFRNNCFTEEELRNKLPAILLEDTQWLESQIVTQKIPDGVRVYFNANGGVIRTFNKVVLHNQIYGELPDGTKKGYTLAGWYNATTDKMVTNKTVLTMKESHTLDAIWKPQKYTLSFNANGGSVKTKSKTVTYDATCGTLPTPRRDGYEFVGWHMAKTKGNKITGATKVSITSNRTAYAYWAKSSVLSFNGNGGSVKTKSKMVAYGMTCGTLPMPTRSGYRFLGWYMAKTGGNKITASTKVTITRDRTAYAHWAKNVTLTFEGNGGSVKTKSKTVTYGLTCGTLPVPTRSGYKFVGWYMAKTGGNKITASTKVTITRNRTAYARWEKA